MQSFNIFGAKMLSKTSYALSLVNVSLVQSIWVIIASDIRSFLDLRSFGMVPNSDFVGKIIKYTI